MLSQKLISWIAVPLAGSRDILVTFWISLIQPLTSLCNLLRKDESEKRAGSTASTVIRLFCSRHYIPYEYQNSIFSKINIYLIDCLLNHRMNIERNLRNFNILLQMKQTQLEFSHLLLGHRNTHFVVFILTLWRTSLVWFSMSSIYISVEIGAHSQMNIRVQKFISTGLTGFARVGSTR